MKYKNLNGIPCGFEEVVQVACPSPFGNKEMIKKKQEKKQRLAYFTEFQWS